MMLGVRQFASKLFMTCGLYCLLIVSGSQSMPMRFERACVVKLASLAYVLVHGLQVQGRHTASSLSIIFDIQT
jgi:hypothetical protein